MPNLAYTFDGATGATGPGASGVDSLNIGVTGVISVNWTDEVESVDITHRGSATGENGPSVATAFRVATGGFIARTIEIECLDASTVMTALATGPNAEGFQVMSVTENQPLDGPVTYNVTVREG